VKSFRVNMETHFLLPLLSVLVACDAYYFYSPRAYSTRPYYYSYNPLYSSPRTSYYKSKITYQNPTPIVRNAKPNPLQIQTPTSSDCSSEFCKTYGFNLGEKVRFEQDRQTPKTRLLAQNPKTAPLIQEMVDANPCVSNLREYGDMLEEGAVIIEKNAAGIEELIITTLSLKSQSNITAITMNYANMFLLLDELWTDVSSYICLTDPEAGVKAIRDLALVLYKLSLVEDIPGLQTRDTAENFEYAAQIVEGLSNVVERYLKNLAEIDCETTADPMAAYTKLSAETVNDVGQFMGSLGYYENAKSVREQASFLFSIADSVSDLDERPLDCSSGKLKRAASVVMDLAAILE